MLGKHLQNCAQRAIRNRISQIYEASLRLLLQGLLEQGIFVQSFNVFGDKKSDGRTDGRNKRNRTLEIQKISHQQQKVSDRKHRDRAITFAQQGSCMSSSCSLQVPSNNHSQTFTHTVNIFILCRSPHGRCSTLRDMRRCKIRITLKIWMDQNQKVEIIQYVMFAVTSTCSYTQGRA